MIYFTKDASNCIDNLFYYPYVSGKHLDKATNDIKNILTHLTSLPQTSNIQKEKVQDIGTITYYSDSKNTIITSISWSSSLTKFYYVKSNFILITNDKNISSVHPVYYKIRLEPSFVCDNGFSVVSRKTKKRELFNFINKVL